MAPGQSSSASSPHSLTMPLPSAFCSGSGTWAASSILSAGSLLSARTCAGSQEVFIARRSRQRQQLPYRRPQEQAAGAAFLMPELSRKFMRMLSVLAFDGTTFDRCTRAGKCAGVADARLVSLCYLQNGANDGQQGGADSRKPCQHSVAAKAL